MKQDTQQNKVDMQYRHLGPTGIKVSVISLGNCLNSDRPEDIQTTYDCVQKAWDLGINFFDTAEIYGYGQAEIQLGKALKRLNAPRSHFVLSTKLYFMTPQSFPNTVGLSRKHIIEGIRASLKKLDFDYVDVVFCHRPDNETPMEEICRAFDWVIRKGYAHYWGTSEWTAEDIAQAHMVCQKYKLIKPVVQQPEYNLYFRDNMEFKYRHLFEEKKLGTTIWSPLAGGVLTGKYNKGIPENSRFDKNPDMIKYLLKYLNDQNRQKTIRGLLQFEALAKELDCSMAQLAMAWCINNPDVSTAITGASRVEQLQDNIKAVAIKRKLTSQIERRIEKIFGTAPEGKLDMPKGVVHKSRRFKHLDYAPDQVSQKDKQK